MQTNTTQTSRSLKALMEAQTTTDSKGRVFIIINATEGQTLTNAGATSGIFLPVGEQGFKKYELRGKVFHRPLH